MRSIADIEPEICHELKVVLCDLDGTLTARGKLSSEAYSSLWNAHLAGLNVVVVTGRPAGWVDHIARMWPVHGVIGENGALAFRYIGGKMTRYYVYGKAERENFKKKLFELAGQVLRLFPGCAIAEDQPYREFDVAVDFAEDVGPLPVETAIRIKEFFESHGAKAKVSSIHVNAWFGDFDKLSGVKRYLAEEFETDLNAEPRCVLFIGDSPNDEVLFEYLPNSVGVAGIRRFLPFMQKRPAYLTSADEGEGFAEALRVILEKRIQRGS